MAVRHRHFRNHSGAGWNPRATHALRGSCRITGTFVPDPSNRRTTSNSIRQIPTRLIGMAYGVTTTTLLLAIGINPATASATVHLAEIGTTLISGLSHWRFGNVDWKVVRRTALPGAIGAIIGATVLSNLSTEAAAPVMALILLALGLYILIRFTFQGIPHDRLGKPLRKRFLAPLGLVAGFVDATGGGGWGPVGTPAILASGRLEPRKVIGSIDTSEFVIAVAASLGFLFSLGTQGVNAGWVGAVPNPHCHSAPNPTRTVVVVRNPRSARGRRADHRRTLG